MKIMKLLISLFWLSFGCCILNQPSEALENQAFPLSIDRMETQGACKNFTREDCRKMESPFHFIPNTTDEFLCQKQCHENNKPIDTLGIFRQDRTDTTRCRFFTFDRNLELCKLYSSNIYSYDDMCDQIGGPPLPSLENCDRLDVPDCLNMLEFDCNYEGYLDGDEEILSAVDCQEKCLKSPTCKFFIHKKGNKKCELLTSLRRKCNSVRGPPVSKTKGCAARTKCPMKYPYAFKNGTYCCATNEENPRGGTHEEIVSGTCDGVGFDIISTCCKNENHFKCPVDSCIDNKER